MARQLLKDTCTLAAEILDGKYDADLSWIQQACQARRKSMFRRGQQVRLVGTRNPELEGKVGQILKVNPKTITVGVGTCENTPWGESWSGGEFNCSPGLLEVVS